jgi:hypothetical protein
MNLGGERPLTGSYHLNPYQGGWRLNLLQKLEKSHSLAALFSKIMEKYVILGGCLPDILF